MTSDDFEIAEELARTYRNRSRLDDRNAPSTSQMIEAPEDKADEKLHRRSTVRMGIRVVQRAFAPPAPDMYVPGGHGRTCREKAKENRKALLFGCKSAPVDVNLTKNSQAISRSAETVVQRKGKIDIGRVESTTETSWSPEASKKAAFTLPVPASPNLQGRLSETERQGQFSPLDENRCAVQISFSPQLLNGVGPESEEHEGELGVALDKPQDFIRVDEVSGKGNEDLDEEARISRYYRNLCGSQRPSLAAYLAGVPAPKAFTEKFYLLSDGQVRLTVSLDKAIYSHGEDIKVNVHVLNNSNKTVKRMKVFVVQHVDVCMFSNGKFKNVVAMLNPKEDCPINSGRSFEKTYTLTPIKSSTKNWIALEESYNKTGTSLASTVTSTLHNPDDRNVFAIYVSYYVKVKLMVSMMGGEVCLKLPFTLMHTCCDTDQTESLTKVVPDVQLELKPPEKVVVEINRSNRTDEDSRNTDDERDMEQPKTIGIKQQLETFDEIVTMKTVDAEETKKMEEYVNGRSIEEKEYKEKGFSLQRAWCCLKTRRTS
ncbi:hypothetical protein JTB14_031792 [Gonioctena quinquepunctata]|nr:hypothetical protein JTB14_031792 [Gonioctena quinquepunctata]